MADTPRGPRPTVTRRAARRLTLGWLVVLALLVAAAVEPHVTLRPGWSQQRATLVEVPYADCSGATCNMRPLLRLRDGSQHRARLSIEREDELLPSEHFNTGGTVDVWVHAGQAPRGLRPLGQHAALVVRILLLAALLFAAALVMYAIRIPKLAAAERASHRSDHVARWGLGVVAAAIGIALLVAHQHWRTPQYSPERSAGGVYGTERQRSGR